MQNFIRISNSGCIESKPITKMFDRLMSRWVKIWYNMENTNTLTGPGNIRTRKRFGTMRTVVRRNFF